MAEERVQRRLAAILAADVVGYSRLMGDDEAGTLAALKRLRADLVDPTISEHRGRIVKLMGDGVLVEFASVVDAVECAVDIQLRMVERNIDIPDSRRIAFRIGVNLGDIIIDGDDIYGDGVNVAARLEPLSEPGGVCVASIVNESVGNRIDVTFTDAGEVTVKNIERPIRVWKWHPDYTPAPASTAQVTALFSQPEPPSIAVLPFDNMSGDPEQEYFSDGITEDIITDLSRIAGLLVIARNSSFVYKRRSVDIRTVGRELGVSAVLEGSIRRAGNRVRITAQLIDAVSGGHLWGERYDRELTDIFAVQDEVTRHIVDALKVKLTPGEAMHIAEVATTSVEAHDLFLRGREALLGADNTREAFDYAIGCFNRAIELDPDYAEPYVGLAHAYNRDFQNNWTGRTDSKERSARFSGLALEKGPELPYAHYMAALVRFWDRDMEGVSKEIEKALALNPNFALAIGMRGLGRIYDGAPLDAVPDLERAVRLDPLMGHQYWHFIGSAYLIAGQYDKAVEAFRQRIRLAPESDLSRGLLISALGHLGETDEARRIWAELKKINPNYSFDGHIGRLPFGDRADADRIRQGFERAGLKE